MLVLGVVVVGAWPLWRTTAVSGWGSRVSLAVGAVRVGSGLVMLVMASTLVRLIGIVVGCSFGGTSPLQIGFGAVPLVLGALAWTVVGGRRTWDWPGGVREGSVARREGGSRRWSQPPQLSGT